MSAQHLTLFDILFDLDIPSFGDEEDFMMEITETVPNSAYYHRFVNKMHHEKELVLELRKEAIEWQKQGLTVYMLTDDPDIVHALAIEKKYLPFVEFLRRNTKNNIEMIERIFPADIGADYL